MSRKITVVFEETGAKGGKTFNFYLDGAERDLSSIPAEQMTSAEWHACKCFQVYADILARSGSIESVSIINPDTKGNIH